MRKIVDFANVAVTVLAGAYLVLLTLFGTDSLKAVPEGLLASWGVRILFLVIGGVLVGLNINELMKEWKTGGLRSNLRITTDQGTTEFSVPSIEMQLQRELKMEPDIVDPMVYLVPHGEGKPMQCKVELKLRRTKDGLKRIDEIKKHVRDIIDRLISGGLTVDVLVDVRDFVNESIRSQPVSRADGGEFNGPVYTDGGGSEGV